MLLFASLFTNALGQAPPCQILEKYRNIEKFEGEGLDSSPDGSVLYGQVSKTGEIKAWDSQTGRLINVLRPDSDDSFAPLSDIKVNMDGRLVAARTRRRETVWIGETQSGRKVSEFLTPPFGVSSTMHLSPGGEVLLIGDFDKGAALWNVSTGRLISKLEPSDAQYPPGRLFNFSKAAFNRDGSLLAVAYYAHIFLWDGRSGKPIKRIYTTAQENGKTIHFSNRSSIYDLEFSPDGFLLASGGRDWTTQLWEVGSGKLRASLKQGDRVFMVRFSPDGKYLATVSYDDKLINIWDTSNGRLLYSVKGSKSSPFSITFSKPEVGIIAIPLKNSVEFRKIESGQLIENCKGIFGSFLPGGEVFLSSNDQRTLTSSKVNPK